MIKPPVVKVEIIFNAKDTVWLKVWKYNSLSPAEQEVEDLDKAIEIIKAIQASPLGAADDNN
jgi:hypothetical protein